MSLVSISFFLLVALAVILYYLVPMKYRWMILMLSSVFFIVSVNDLQMTAVMAVTVLFTYLSAILLEKYKEKGRISRCILAVGIVVNVSSLVALKDSNFFISMGRHLQTLLGQEGTWQNISLLAPLGISYYTLTLTGYLLDVYWGTEKAERNVFQFLLFAGYFPLLTSGPIIRAKDTKKEILQGHRFSDKRFCLGLQRILWGLFKKLVVSEHLAIIVNAVYNDFEKYTGVYVWIAVLTFPLQLYADFSGCLDIVIGVSELFGVTLPENFDMPFLSKNLTEFWRRWHITLGGFLRDYVLYPILKSALWQKIGKATKKCFGKKLGKQIPVWLGMMVSWFLIGFWHGGAWNFIIGVGLYFWFWIVLGELCKSFLEKLTKILKINTECFSWKVFQAVRTYFLFMIGLSLFRSYGGIGEGILLWKSAFVWNPQVLAYAPLKELGMSAHELGVLNISMLVLAVSGILRVWLKRPLREWFAEQNVVFRWGILYLMIFFVVIYGYYGLGYDASTFIYAQF